MTTTEVRKRSVELVKKLREVGIKANVPKRNRAGDEIFLIDREDNGTIRFWAGGAKIDVKGDKDHKQAVLNVTEEKRVISHKDVRVSFRYDSPDLPKEGQPLTERARRKFVGAFPISLPDEATYRVTNIRKDPKHGSPIDTYPVFMGDITATVPETKMAFLVGKDEHSQFISALPQQARSVSHAHNILRPKGVPKDAPRQGEWFFKLVTDKVRSELDGLIQERPARILFDEATELCEDEDTTHFAHQVQHKGKYYAIGWVVDIRQGRYGRQLGNNSRHVPLLLQDWHEVIRNNEVPNRNDDQSWD